MLSENILLVVLNKKTILNTKAPYLAERHEQKADFYGFNVSFYCFKSYVYDGADTYFGFQMRYRNRWIIYGKDERSTQELSTNIDTSFATRDLSRKSRSRKIGLLIHLIL